MYEMLIGSFLSAIATGVGALPILFIRDMSHKWRDILLAYSAGVMMAATMLGLIPQSLESSGMLVLIAGLLVGTFVLYELERRIPHQHIEQGDAFHHQIDVKAKLIILALLFHNIPEGFSVGVSYASEAENLGGIIALSIGVQNAPEGLIIAIFLLNSTLNKWKAVGIATLTGLIEVVAAVIGFLLSSVFSFFVGFGLAFAAGATLFIVYKELIPESHGHGFERYATWGFLAGVITLLLIV